MHCFHRPSNPIPNYSLAQSMSLRFTSANTNVPYIHTLKHINVYTLYVHRNQTLVTQLAGNQFKNGHSYTNTHRHTNTQCCYDTLWFFISFCWPLSGVSSKGPAHNLAQSRNAETRGELDHLWADPTTVTCSSVCPLVFQGIQSWPLVVTSLSPLSGLCLNLHNILSDHI